MTCFKYSTQYRQCTGKVRVVNLTVQVDVDRRKWNWDENCRGENRKTPRGARERLTVAGKTLGFSPKGFVPGTLPVWYRYHTYPPGEGLVPYLSRDHVCGALSRSALHRLVPVSSSVRLRGEGTRAAYLL